MSMRKSVLALTGALALGATALMAGAAQAVPASLSKSLNAAAGAIDLVEQAGYYGGRRYCVHFGAWGGPGLTICDSSRRGGHAWYPGPGYRGPVYHGRAYRHYGPRPYQHQRRQRQPIGDY